MYKYQIFAFVGMIILLGITIFIASSVFNPNQTNQPTEPPTEGNNNNGDSGSNSDQSHQDNQKFYWGVDSASYTDGNLYQCVKDNFGQPDVWGRYLGDKEDVSVGLDSDEVHFLHKNDVKILIIYNHFTDATGYDKGVKEAEQAITYAEDLSIPGGVAIFADIEPSYPVDSAFLEGWYKALAASAYETGLYGVFDEGSTLLDAYNATNQNTRENTIVWTAYPQTETTTKENAPEYNPQGPSNSLLYGWQYGLEAKQCNIDTNLFTGEMVDYLW